MKKTIPIKANCPHCRVLITEEITLESLMRAPWLPLAVGGRDCPACGRSYMLQLVPILWTVEGWEASTEYGIEDGHVVAREKR